MFAVKFQIFNLIVLAALISTTTIGCKSRNINTSETKQDITLSPNDKDLNTIKTFIEDMSANYEQEQGLISTDKIFSFMPLAENERALIRNNRIGPATFRCYDLNVNKITKYFCQITSIGTSELTTTLQNIQIPVIGIPTLILAEKVVLNIRFISPDEIEICNAEGITIQTLKKQNFDGAHLSAVDKSKTFIDVGWFGSYPAKKCEFQTNLN